MSLIGATVWCLLITLCLTGLSLVGDTVLNLKRGLTLYVWLGRCMVQTQGSLKALSERYRLGAKGTEVIAAKGMNRDDFSSDQLSKYGDYCVK